MANNDRLSPLCSRLVSVASATSLDLRCRSQKKEHTWWVTYVRSCLQLNWGKVSKQEFSESYSLIDCIGRGRDVFYLVRGWLSKKKDDMTGKGRVVLGMSEGTIPVEVVATPVRKSS